MIPPNPKKQNLSKNSKAKACTSEFSICSWGILVIQKLNDGSDYRRVSLGCKIYSCKGYICSGRFQICKSGFINNIFLSLPPCFIKDSLTLVEQTPFFYTASRSSLHMYNKFNKQKHPLFLSFQNHFPPKSVFLFFCSPIKELPFALKLACN